MIDIVAHGGGFKSLRQIHLAPQLRICEVSYVVYMWKLYYASPILIFGRSDNPIPTGGEQIIPTNYYWHPQLFLPSGISIWHLKHQFPVNNISKFTYKPVSFKSNNFNDTVSKGTLYKK